MQLGSGFKTHMHMSGLKSKQRLSLQEQQQYEQQHFMRAQWQNIFHCLHSSAGEILTAELKMMATPQSLNT